MAKQDRSRPIGNSVSPAQPELVSQWEKVLYQAVYQAGLRPIPQYSEEKYFLDSALFEGQRKLDVEVDGEQYHRNWDGELSRRDVIRSQRLMELGWDVMRFWGYQVRDEMDACIQRVRGWLGEARGPDDAIGGCR